MMAILLLTIQLCMILCTNILAHVLMVVQILKTFVQIFLVNLITSCID